MEPEICKAKCFSDLLDESHWDALGPADLAWFDTLTAEHLHQSYEEKTPFTDVSETSPQRADPVPYEHHGNQDNIEALSSPQLFSQDSLYHGSQQGCSEIFDKSRPHDEDEGRNDSSSSTVTSHTPAGCVPLSSVTPATRSSLSSITPATISSLGSGTPARISSLGSGTPATTSSLGSVTPATTSSLSSVTPLSALVRKKSSLAWSGYVPFPSPLLVDEMPTPRTRMAEALGVENESHVSWTESLATPCRTLTDSIVSQNKSNQSAQFLTEAAENNHPQPETLGAARQLFSPSVNHSTDDLVAKLDDTAEEDTALTDVQHGTTLRYVHHGTTLTDLQLNTTLTDVHPVLDLPDNSDEVVDVHSNFHGTNGLPNDVSSNFQVTADVNKDISSKSQETGDVTNDVSSNFQVMTDVTNTATAVEEASDDPESSSHNDTFDHILSVFFEPPRTRHFYKQRSKQESKTVSCKARDDKEDKVENNTSVNRNNTNGNHDDVIVKYEVKDEDSLKIDLKSPQLPDSGVPATNLSGTPNVSTVTKDGSVSVTSNCETSGVFSVSNNLNQADITNSTGLSIKSELKTEKICPVPAPSGVQGPCTTPVMSVTPHRGAPDLSVTPHRGAPDLSITPHKGAPDHSLTPHSGTKDLSVTPRRGSYDELFSQISPGVLDSMFQAAATSTPAVSCTKQTTVQLDSLSTPGINTPLSEANPHVPDVITPVRWKRKEPGADKLTQPPRVPQDTRTETPGNTNLPSSSAQAPRLTKTSGLRKRKAKRFSYPTNSQVCNSCPETVFKFDADAKWKHLEIKRDVAAEHTADTVAPHDQGDIVEKSCTNLPGDTEHVPGEKGDGPGLKDQGNLVTKIPEVKKLNTSGFTTLTTYDKQRLESPADPSIPSIDGDRKHTVKVEHSEVSDNLTSTDNSRVLDLDNATPYIQLEQKDTATEELVERRPAQSETEEQEKRFKESPLAPTLSDQHYSSHIAVNCAELDSNTPLVNSNQIVGFKSASGRGISVSASAIQKAKGISEAVDMSLNTDSTAELNKENTRVTTDRVSHVKDEMTRLVSDKAGGAVGFTSASGKGISISSRALLKAEELSRDVEKSIVKQRSVGIIQGNDTAMGKKSEHEFGGFKSASGKGISVTAAALKKAAAISDDVDRIICEKEKCVNTESNARDSVLISEPLCVPGQPVMAVGFSSASGKGICVSKLALHKARTLATEVDKTVASDDAFKSEAENKHSSSTTVTSHCVNNTNTSHEVSNTTTTEKVTRSTTSRNVKPKPADKDYSKVPKGFRPFKRPRLSVGTGSNVVKETTAAYNRDKENAAGRKTKTVDVTSRTISPLMTSPELSRTQAREVTETMTMIEGDELFSDVSFSQGREQSAAEPTNVSLQGAEKISSNSCHFTEMPSKPAAFVGFATAAGSALRISADAMKKARSLVSECETVETNIQPETHPQFSTKAERIVSDGHGKPTTTPPFLGFSTAAGATLRVSENAMQKARSLVSKCETAERETHPQCASFTDSGVSGAQPAAPPKFTGFSTASGATLRVSEQAIKRAQTLVQEIETSDTSGAYRQSPTDVRAGVSETGAQPTAPPRFPGFSTARGTSVAVSEVALGQARRLLETSDSSSQSQSSDAPSSSDVQVVPTSPKEAAKTRQSSQLKSLSTFQNSSNLVSFGANRPNEELGENQPDNCAPAQPVYYGFQTAGGASVAISETALSKARGMIYESEEHQEHQVPKGFSGFQTAGGNTVKVSDSAVAKARVVLKDAQQVDSNDGSHSNTQGNQANVCITRTQFQGFQTGRGQSVSVSAAALAKARHVLTETQEESEASKISKTENAVATKGFSGFQTAKGTSVAVSKSALEQARGFLMECENGDTDAEPVKPSLFQGFQTGGGKSVSISKSTLNNARDLLNSTDKETISACKSGDGSPAAGFSGFQTAGGGTVAVSETSLAQARGLLQGCEDDERPAASTNQLTPGTFQGFQTAGGGTVAVSETSPAQARGLLQGCEDDERPAANTNQLTPGAFQGFQTAGGGTVAAVSETSLAQARGLLQGCEDDERPAANTNQLTPGTFQGFQTAGGGTVAVSETSLAQARGLLQGCEDDERPAASTNQLTPGAFQGFQTAGGGTVAVSETSLAQARGLLQGCSDDERIRESTNQTNPGTFHGFQTCTGKTVAVSHDSLSKAISLFSECEETEGVSVAPTDETPKLPSADHALRSLDGKMISREYAVGSDKQLTTDVDFTLEAYESAKALLEDGDFDNWDDDFDDEGTKEWMAAHVTSAEENLMDREKTDRTVELKPQHTVPINNNAKYSVTPKKLSYRDVNQLVNHRNDRPEFSINRRNIKQTARAAGTAACTEKSGGFNVPVKGSSVNSSTINHESCSTQSKFNTPYKQAPQSTSFKTPGKAEQKSQESKSHDPESKEPETSVDVSEEQADSVSDGKDEEELPVTEVQRKRPDVSLDVQKRRLRRKVSQAMKIKEKREKGNTRPVTGQMLQQRLSGNHGNNVPLHQAVEGQAPASLSQRQLTALGVRQSTLSLGSNTAESYRFLLEEHYCQEVVFDADGVLLGDGAFLVFAEDSTAGKEEFCNALLDLTGVEPKLINRDWVFNHYRWIVWKLAALETSFPHQFAGRALTPNNVMFQLKYRYDREIDLSQRSALKKIYEKDDTPQKPMVLCVSGILQVSPDNPSKENSSNNTGNIKNFFKPVDDPKSVLLELTDGWYSIKATMDRPLSRLIQQGQIAVGHKLFIYGAEMLGSQDGCPPLEATADSMLRVVCNAVRRARWFSKLGFFPRAPCLPISSLYPDGGNVGCVDVVIARVYPLQYMEKSSGGNVFRTERAEQRAAQEFEKGRQKQLEKIYCKLEADFEKKSSKSGKSERGGRLNRTEIKQLDSGDEIYQAWQQAPDPEGFENLLSSDQLELLGDYRRGARDEEQADLQQEFRRQLEEFELTNPKRTSVPLLKIKVSGCHNKDIDSNIQTTLTVWRPSSDLTNLLTEGKRFKLFNLSVGENRSKALSCPVSLSATRSTQYQPVVTDPNFLDLVYDPRDMTSLRELQGSTVTSLREGNTCIEEVDIVGVVVQVSSVSEFERTSGGSGRVQTVYLCDAEADFIQVKFWGSLKMYHLEEMLKPGTVVSAANLQLRQENNRSVIPQVTVSDLSVFSTNPRDPHLRVEHGKLGVYMKANPGFLLDVRSHLGAKLGGGSASMTPTSYQTPNHGRSRPVTPGSRVQTPVVSRDMATPAGSTLAQAYDTPISHSDPQDEESPLVARQRHIQKQKALKLEMYENMYSSLSPGVVTSVPRLASPVTGPLRRAFKAPSMNSSSAGSPRSGVKLTGLDAKPPTKNIASTPSRVTARGRVGGRRAANITTPITTSPMTSQVSGAVESVTETRTQAPVEITSATSPITSSFGKTGETLPACTSSDSKTSSHDPGKTPNFAIGSAAAQEESEDTDNTHGPETATDSPPLSLDSLLSQEHSVPKSPRQSPSQISVAQEPSSETDENGTRCVKVKPESLSNHLTSGSSVTGDANLSKSPPGDTHIPRIPSGNVRPPRSPSHDGVSSKSPSQDAKLSRSNRRRGCKRKSDDQPETPRSRKSSRLANSSL